MKVSNPSKPLLHRKPGEYTPSWLYVERNATPPMRHGANHLGLTQDGREAQFRYAYGPTGLSRLKVPEGTLSYERKQGL